MTSTTTYPAFSRGTLILGKSNSYEKDIKTIDITKKLRPDERTLIENDFNDIATNVGWCLDEGDVVTLFRDTSCITNANEDIHSSLTVDCVGTGSSCYYTLPGDTRKALSGYVWKKYDRTLGYVELFTEKNFQGYSVKIFLSHYNMGKLHSMTSWYFNDKIKSMKWDKLGELCEVQFFQHDGTGRSLDFVMGRQQNGVEFQNKQVADLETYLMSGQITSFQWRKCKAVRQVIHQARINLDGTSSTTRTVSSVGGKVQGVNKAYQTHEYELSLGEGVTMTSSISFNEEVSVNLEAGFSVSYEPLIGVGGSISMSYTHGSKNASGSGKTSVNTTTIASTKTVTIPARSSYSIDWKLQISSLPPTKFETMVTSWYDIPLKDSTFDESTGYYKRTETLTGEFKGDYYYKTILATTYESLKKGTAIQQPVQIKPSSVVDNDSAAITQLLVGAGIPEAASQTYVKKLVEQGYDSIAALSAMPKDELQSLMNAIGVSREHQASFSAAMTKLSSSAPAAIMAPVSIKVRNTSFTNWSDGADKTLCYLDRQNVSPEDPNSVMLGFRLERNGGQVRYAVKSGIVGIDQPQNVELRNIEERRTDWAEGAEGELANLSRQVVTLSDNRVLIGFQLERSGGSIRYKYRSAQLFCGGYLVPLINKSEHSTPWALGADKREPCYLDRQNVEVPGDYRVLTGFTVQRQDSQLKYLFYSHELGTVKVVA